MVTANVQICAPDGNFPVVMLHMTRDVEVDANSEAVSGSDIRSKTAGRAKASEERIEKLLPALEALQEQRSLNLHSCGYSSEALR